MRVNLQYLQAFMFGVEILTPQSRVVQHFGCMFTAAKHERQIADFCQRKSARSPAVQNPGDICLAAARDIVIFCNRPELPARQDIESNLAAGFCSDILCPVDDPFGDRMRRCGEMGEGEFRGGGGHAGEPDCTRSKGGTHRPGDTILFHF
jgi:hypothetical protein